MFRKFEDRVGIVLWLLKWEMRRSQPAAPAECKGNVNGIRAFQLSEAEHREHRGAPRAQRKMRGKPCVLSVSLCTLYSKSDY